MIKARYFIHRHAQRRAELKARLCHSIAALLFGASAALSLYIAILIIGEVSKWAN